MVNFDYLSKDAWKTLNVTYDRLSGSAQYDMAGEAKSSVRDCIRTTKKGCPPYANLKTLESGLETLRKIGKSIILSSNTVSHEVRIGFQHDRILEDTMVGIMNATTDPERDTLVSQGPDGAWIDKLEELANAHCIFKGLGDVVQLLEGGDGEREDGKEVLEEDENEDEEEEEEVQGEDAE